MKIRKCKPVEFVGKITAIKEKSEVTSHQKISKSINAKDSIVISDEAKEAYKELEDYNENTKKGE